MSDCKFKVGESYPAKGVEGLRKVVFIGEHTIAVTTDDGHLFLKNLDGTDTELESIYDLMLPEPKSFDASKPSGFDYFANDNESPTENIYVTSSRSEYLRLSNDPQYTNWHVVPTYDVECAGE